MEDVGRVRHGRQSNAHSSAHREFAANAPVGKRGRSRQGTPLVQGPPPVQGAPLVQGTYDAEAGGSRSHTRSRLGRAQVQVPDAEDDYDAGQYLNDDTEWAEEPEHDT
ncbi:hypothetical protein A2U01_0036789 [Trifolium medium]|uniref:Uncharacterized protein n=1 Tax=Trifolium medium TaxID=97028 RepID=A0A392PU82_9FABA|nr:hypothetical protein [Trifolium medium]